MATTKKRKAKPAKAKKTTHQPVAAAKKTAHQPVVAQTLHITGEHQFRGQRAQVWAMIKEGMTVQALYEKCAKAGLNGKSVLAKIIEVGKCVERVPVR